MSNLLPKDFIHKPIQTGNVSQFHQLEKITDNASKIHGNITKSGSGVISDHNSVSRKVGRNLMHLKHKSMDMF